MKVNKIINVFLLFLIFICLTTVVVAELPNNASTDGNHFYQEIIVESEINQQNASVQINLPFQYNYSNIISTYRVYDSVGNPIRFHVMETSLSESSILLKMDLLDGKNTIYVTGGNYSLQNISDETVYDTLFKNITLNAITTEQFGYYNLMEARFSNITANTYPQLNFTNESNASLSSLYAVNNSSTSSVRYIYDSGSQNYVEFSSVRSLGTERFTISIQGSNGGTEIHTYGYRNNTYFTKTELNNSYNFYGTGFKYDPVSSSVWNITHMGFSNVTPTQNEIGEIIVIKNEGLYIKIVDGVTGKPLSGTEHIENKLIANETTVIGIHMNNIITYMSYNATFTQNGVTNYYKIGQGRESVIYIPDFSYDSPFSITFPAGTNISITQFSGIVIPENLSKSSIDMPIYRIITDQNNTSSGAVYGLLTDRYGQPVPNATVTYIRNGSIVETVLVQDGGEWGRKSLVGETYIRFEAPGFKTTEGYVTGPSMNYIVMEGIYNITIGAIDSATQENILAFTTYLGENQTIQSTDNGTVKYFNVSEGEIDIIIQADGYNQISRKIYIGDNKTDFVFSLSKISNETLWVEPNYVTFNIIDQFGESVRNADVAVQTLDGPTIFSRTLEGSSSFVVELNRTTNYKITVSKPSENIYQTLTIYGSSLSAYMYISVSRSVQGALDLFNGTYISFDAPKNQFIVTATATDSRITDLYFTETDVKYSIQGSATNGSLGAPTITKPSANTIVATWNISDLYQNGGVILSSNITIGSNQTGNQTMRVKNVMLARENGTGDQSLKLDLGIDKETMQWISIFIIIATALITSSAGIPYLSTLAPIVVYYILWWAGWITLPTGVVVLFAIGLIVVAYDMIKKSKM